MLITSDDQADYDMRWMPKTRRLIGRAGVTFTDAVSPHPLCCPARAQILTGQYAHNNGVRTNGGWYGRGRALRGYHNTIARWLSDAGYRTGFTGKFLHHYSAHKIRPRGWDQWHPFLDARGLYRYYHYAVEHNGRNRYHARMHKSDFLARQSVRLVRRFHRFDRPFFIWQSHLAPHGARVGGRWTDPVPAYRHRDELRRVRPPSFRSPAFMEANMRDKPRYLWQMPQPSVDRLRRRFTRRIQTLQSLDEAVAKTLRALRRTRELRTTLVIFTSDNGYLLGEHRYQGKVLAYEESLQVPLLMRGPGIPRGKTRRDTVATIDLAPTFLDAANTTVGVRIDGRSLLPLARRGRVHGYNTLLVQAGPRTGTPLERTGTDPSGWFFRGVRTHRYTFVNYPRYRTELYDRARDRHQLRNVAGKPAYRAVQRALAHRTGVLKHCSGRGCRRNFDPVPTPRR